MTMKIYVYVRSNQIVRGVPKPQNEGLYGGGCTQHSTYLLNNSVVDRLLEPESMEVAQAAQRLARVPGVEVEFVDVGFWVDWGLALLAGVWKTPTVVEGGARIYGLQPCLRALGNLAVRV
jgi:hypothetical protein